MQLNIHQAKTHFSRLIDQTLEGQEVVISRAGKPVVRLVPYQTPEAPRCPGAWKGKVKMAKNFNAPLPKAVLKNFEG